MKTVVLTFDDAVNNHLRDVAPLLKKLCFGATFFICRFNNEWRSKHEPVLMTAEDAFKLSSLGFEIGNHTWNHPCMSNLSDASASQEIDRLSDFLESGGVSRKSVTSFAYPGGPYAENIVPLLKERSFTLARTTEKRAWNPLLDDPFRVPCIPIQGEDESLFHDAISLCGEDNAVVLVFHGVPDTVHDFVSTPFSIFAHYMKYLTDNHYRVLGMREYFETARREFSK